MNVIKIIGLDTLLYLLPGRARGIPEIKTLEVAKRETTEIKANNLSLAIRYAEQSLARTEKTDETVNSKAFVLLSATGISATFLAGFSRLITDARSDLIGFALTIVVFLFVSLIASYSLTIVFTLKVITAKVFFYPSLFDIDLLKAKYPTKFKKEYIASLYLSVIQNKVTVAEKTTFLSCAQTWFRNSVYLLIGLVLAFVYLGIN